MLAVLPRWRDSPLTVVHTSRAWGSRTSSGVTSHGPIGAKVSALLPFVVVPPCSIWHTRAQALEARGREHRGRDVWDHARQVAHGAGFVDEPGLLGPGASVAHEPHGAGPSAPARERIAQNPRKSPSAASTASGLSACSVW